MTEVLNMILNDCVDCLQNELTLISLGLHLLETHDGIRMKKDASFCLASVHFVSMMDRLNGNFISYDLTLGFYSHPFQFDRYFFSVSVFIK